MDFFAIDFSVDIVMRSFSLLTSMELISIPNSSLLYLHSNYRKRLKKLFVKFFYSYK